MLYYHFDHNF